MDSIFYNAIGQSGQSREGAFAESAVPDDDSISSSRPASPCFYSSENPLGPSHQAAFDRIQSPLHESEAIAEDEDTLLLARPVAPVDQRLSIEINYDDAPVPGLTSLLVKRKETHLFRSNCFISVAAPGPLLTKENGIKSISTDSRACDLNSTLGTLQLHQVSKNRSIPDSAEDLRKDFERQTCSPHDKGIPQPSPTPPPQQIHRLDPQVPLIRPSLRSQCGRPLLSFV